jgi:hypothetical protein
MQMAANVEATTVDENAVRAAAGITLMIGAAAFSVALFQKQYVPLQAVTTFFFVEFLARLTVGIHRSPVGVVAHWMTSRRAAEPVSAQPKYFAWKLGLALAFSMTLITNSGIRGWLPRSLCIVCMTLMWMESALGLCLGCQIHAWLVRRGRTAKDPAMVCSGGVCELPDRPAG